MATTSAQAPSVLTLAVPQQAEAIGRARHAVRDVLTEHSWPDELIDTVVLVVSELVSNAVRHGRPPIELRLQVIPGFAAGRVSDRSLAMPVPVETDDDAESGRGLAIVQAMTSRWGTLPLPERGGKAVWFEFRHPPDHADLPSLGPLLRGVPGLGSSCFRGDLNAPSFGSRFN
ncbi:ATP-binding protein [Nonomuraea longicatena]|uniref:Histidine kinase/HSP90-like ATPase domain-containing protein n=1 Tax=Nonomuraea longicatena TaxID=83682 RepID=A0ABP4AMK8_9ACTN